MSAIGKGDWLQAIKAWPKNDFLVVGNVYVVSGFAAADECRDCGDTGPGILLVDDPCDQGSWCRCFFRPLKPPGDEARPVEAKAPELEAA